MSSHHFVREGQEPALIIADPISYQAVSAFLEWAPLVIAFDQTLETVVSWGVKTDVVFSRQENLEACKELSIAQQPLSLIEVGNDNAQLATALNYLRKIRQNDVSIAVEDSRLAVSQIGPEFQDLNIVFFDDSQKWWRVKNRRFEKWLTKGTTLHFHSRSDTMKIFGPCISNQGSIEMQEDALLKVISEVEFWLGQDI